MRVRNVKIEKMITKMTTYDKVVEIKILLIYLFAIFIRLFPYKYEPRNEITHPVIDNNSRLKPLKKAKKPETKIITRIIKSNIIYDPPQFL